MMRITRGTLACAAIVVAGCAGNGDEQVTGTGAATYEDDAPVRGSTSAQLNPSSSPSGASEEIFVTLYQCAAHVGSKCIGGYWVRVVNTRRTWLVALDVSQLGSAAIEQANGGETQLILRGHVAPADEPSSLATYVALEAWRGLPDVEPPGDAGVVAVGVVDGVRYARSLNGTSESPFETLAVSDFAPRLVDPAWLSARVLDHGGLVSGAVQGTTLQASQVFVHLPDTPGPCLHWRSECGADEITTFTRDEDRCLNPTGCLVPRPCPLDLPVCPPGYVRSAWPSQPAGCPAFACDAAFLSQ
ncbi:MAG TPA: hypothetical protein VIJ22_10365 [Polyangiaceae bacterium]